MASEDLIEVRQTTHGNAWKATNQVLQYLAVWYREEMQGLQFSGYYLNWIMVLNKLMRLLFRPHYVEHWEDIEGWAHLVVRDLQPIRPEDPK
jgi:hypothetical protein